MPWTESRSREEWLAEVRRRGERIRRRRRFTVAMVGAFALVLPLSAIAGYLVGPPDRSVELSVAGPAPAAVGLVMSPTSPAVDDIVTSGLPALPEATPPLAGAPSQITTTTEVHRPAAAVSEPVVEPVPRTVPASVPPGDDPVVRSPATTAPPTAAGSAGIASSGGVGTALRTDSQSVPLCGQSDLRLTVATDKPAYAVGEPVKVTATLEKRTSAACRLPSQVHVPIDNSAGRNVVPFPYTLDIPVPDNPEPGMTFTGSYTWDQRDCVNASCAQAPAGTYGVYGSAPMAERVSFQVGS